VQGREPALTLKGDSLNSAFPKIPGWAWIVAAIIALSLIVGQFRSCMKQATKEAVQKVLLREYGDAVQDYRSDPVRFRARFHELARREGLSQQETEEGIEMVRKMSQTLP
jgi:hypothetical protein